MVTKYTFDLKTNELTTSEEDNPTAGTVHRFRAYRLKGAPQTEVKMKQRPVLPTNEDADAAEATPRGKLDAPAVNRVNSPLQFRLVLADRVAGRDRLVRQVEEHLRHQDHAGVVPAQRPLASPEPGHLRQGVRGRLLQDRLEVQRQLGRSLFPACGRR